MNRISGIDRINRDIDFLNHLKLFNFDTFTIQDFPSTISYEYLKRFALPKLISDGLIKIIGRKVYGRGRPLDVYQVLQIPTNYVLRLPPDIVETQGKLNWAKQNKDKVLESARKSRRKLFSGAKKTHYQLARNLRNRLNRAIQRNTKVSSSFDLIGCNLDEIKNYLESLFLDGMTWDNYGLTGWHIDHIIPCSAFDLSDPEQQKMCFHYSNLQPLWACDNFKKSDSLDWCLEERSEA